MSPSPGLARGTSNGNVSGNSYARRRRREWLVETWAANVSPLQVDDEGGTLPVCRCYRCGKLLHAAAEPRVVALGVIVAPLTVDRIVPGCRGGRYVRNNIRPACAACNSETGGATRRKAAR